MRTVKWLLTVSTAVMLALTGCDNYGEGGGPDVYRDAVSDRRAPDMTVTVRDDGEPAVDITYKASGEGRIPLRGTYAYLQTLDEGTWSTAYTLDTDEIVTAVAEAEEDDARSGTGPDTYPLPDLNAADTYRICVSFVVGHPAADATGCSAPFHSN
jgi:hypothetical protein